MLRTLIEVIDMPDDVNVLQRYFDDDAWAKARRYYEEWPSSAWRDLFRDVEAALAEDPGSEHAQALAARWDATFKADGGDDPRVRAGMWRAWTDRQQWPAALTRRAAGYDIERIWAFIGEAAWANLGPDGQPRRTSEGRAPDRVSDSRIALFREIARSLHDDPTGAKAERLVAAWEALLEREAGADEEAKSGQRRMLANRVKWPAGMKRYIASLYEMDVETWTAVADFLERTQGECNPGADVAVQGNEQE